MAKQKAAKLNIYDELNDLRGKVLNVVDTIDETVEAYKKAEHTNIPNREHLVTMVETVSTDAAKYRADMDKLYTEHKDLKGSPKRQSQFMTCHAIGNDYLQILETMTAATLPVVADIIIALDEVVNK